MAVECAVRAIHSDILTDNGMRANRHQISPRRTSYKKQLQLRTLSSDNGFMTGNEFIRKVKAYGKARGVVVTLNASRGKGSHQTLYLGSVFTIVRNPKDELKTGTFHGMCSQLGVKPNEL